ncbi:hypothetical protein LLG95_18320, partial [bacterium]|nr:hypothetical protein [bacterium]
YMIDDLARMTAIHKSLLHMSALAQKLANQPSTDQPSPTTPTTPIGPISPIGPIIPMSPTRPISSSLHAPAIPLRARASPCPSPPYRIDPM